METGRITVVADTGFMVAMANSRDRYHQLCVPIYLRFPRILVPQSVVTESTLVIRSSGGNNAVAAFLTNLNRAENLLYYRLNVAILNAVLKYSASIMILVWILLMRV